MIDYAGTIDELEKSTNPFAFVILAHLMTMQTANDLEDRCQWKMRLLRPTYERGMSPEDVRKLFRVLAWMMQLPEDLQLQFRDQLEQYGQEKKMPYITSIERIGMEKGRKERRKLGRKLGRKKVWQVKSSYCSESYRCR